MTTVDQDRVLALDAPLRFSYFVKKVVKQEFAWGLWNDGWALMEDDSERLSLPLWPEPEYAQLLATHDWRAHKPDKISLRELRDTIIPRVEENSILIAVFPTPTGKGIVVTGAELKVALTAEMSVVRSVNLGNIRYKYSSGRDGKLFGTKT